jgi:hypothetical protein
VRISSSARGVPAAALGGGRRLGGTFSGISRLLGSTSASSSAASSSAASTSVGSSSGVARRVTRVVVAPSSPLPATARKRRRRSPPPVCPPLDCSRCYSSPLPGLAPACPLDCSCAGCRALAALARGSPPAGGGSSPPQPAPAVTPHQPDFEADLELAIALSASEVPAASGAPRPRPPALEEDSPLLVEDSLPVLQEPQLAGGEEVIVVEESQELELPHRAQ